MSTSIRNLSYSLAINEAIHQMMSEDKNLLLLGQGVKSPWYVGNTASGLLEKFGDLRVIDTPVSENAMTGAAVGAAITGMPAIIVHPRMDFMMYAFDPIINEAANWSYMCGGKSSAPVVIWGVINRKGEQAAQHSQALQALFAHIPGLKVVAPSNPVDAKGLMIAAIRDKNPVIFVDDRWLYNLESHVPKNVYEIPIGKAAILKKGKDITLVSSSYLLQETLKAAKQLAKEDISAEVVDLRTIKPLDKDLICKSVKKTGKLVIIDGGWKSFGVSAEISAMVSENIFSHLKAPIKRLALDDIPAPSSSVLEEVYYKGSKDIVKLVKSIL